MRYSLSCWPFDTHAYVSVLSAHGSLSTDSASRWLDPCKVMLAAASTAPTIAPFVHRLKRFIDTPFERRSASPAAMNRARDSLRARNGMGFRQEGGPVPGAGSSV